MALAELAIGVLMERRRANHPWAQPRWCAAGIVPWDRSEASLRWLDEQPGEERYVAGGLRLELRADEDDGYFENWVAPAPKVFVMWQLREALAIPVLASVSYAEGTRMMDSGDSADGLPMPAPVHEWLGSYLRLHYRPKPRRGRAHG
jgi:hypothetical protein